MQPNTKLNVRVRKITEETPTIKRFTLQVLDHSTSFSGGSHITTFIPLSSGPLERHYSIFNLSSEEGQFEIAVRLAEDSTGGSRYWHEKVHVGDVLSVSCPKNFFPLSYQAKHHVFYAAGIGITPFLSMMAELKKKIAPLSFIMQQKQKSSALFMNIYIKSFQVTVIFIFPTMKNVYCQTDF